MAKESKKILFAGEGGKGVQTIAEVITAIALEQGQNATYIPYFGVEQRGAPSVAYVTIAKGDIFYPRFEEADSIIVMRERALKYVEKFITPNTDLIFDSSTIDSKKMHKLATKIYGFPGSKYVLEKYGAKTYNSLVLGVVGNYLGFKDGVLWGYLHNKLKNKFKTEEIKKKNKEALEFGARLVLERNEYSKPDYKSNLEDNFYQNKEKRAIIKPSLCKGCGICIEKCPVKALSFGEDIGVFGTNVPTIDLQKCITCGNCRRFCPDSAIAVEKK